MLLKNRNYTVQEPERDAKSIYIFCEGVKREKQYFKFFEGFDSRINIVVYDLQDTEDNSALGLGNIVKNAILSDTNPTGKYELIEGDEIWIVLDTDIHGNTHRIETLKTIREDCANQNWNIAQSNPCFEVWLYYHQENQKPNFEAIEIPAKWKTYVGEVIKGGFNPRKHPILIQTAIINSETHYLTNQDGFPHIATTEVFKLAQNILAIGNIKAKIESELENMKL